MAAGPLNLHIQSFMLHLRAEKKSDRTVSMYRESVAWFAAEHLLVGGQPTDIDHRYETSADTCADMVTFEPVRDWELVSRVHIRSWLVRLHRREYSSSYVNNQYRCLQQFFKWLADEEEIGDPMRKVAPPKVVAKPVPVFEDGEIDRILKMPPTKHDRGVAKRGDACKLRDAAIIQLLSDTGVRLAELASLDLDDVVVTSRTGRVREVGTGARGRTVPLPARTRPPISAWREARCQMSGTEATNALFVARGERRIAARTIDHVIRTTGRQVGLEISPHILRHTFVTNRLRGGQDLVDVAEVLGHARVETVRVCTLPTEE